MKKIHVIQYGVGPIGAGMVRLMAQKPEIKIVGAIDVDPNKAGKDLGEVAGVAASWASRSAPMPRPCWP